MVFVMKYINYILLLMSVSFLYALLITTNSPLALQTHSWVYASEKEDNQEKVQSSSENEDGSNEVNSESESSQGDTDSDQLESNSKGNDDNDVSSTNQNSNCPNITEISNLPLYLGQDGCQYPCLSFDSNDQDDVPEGCPIEPLTSQTNTGFSVKERRTQHNCHLKNSNRLKHHKSNKMVRTVQTKMSLLIHQLTVILVLLFLIVKALLLRNPLLLPVNLEVAPHKQNQAYLCFQMIPPNLNLLSLEM